ATVDRVDLALVLAIDASWSVNGAEYALDDRLLADIGVSREAAVAEAMRDPYDLPRDRCPQCDDRVAMPASAMALMRPLS
ncbi:MAG: hypothetical protein AAGJ70_14620, partial [Pseudomonadota bacterium]